MQSICEPFQKIEDLTRCPIQYWKYFHCQR